MDFHNPKPRFKHLIISLSFIAALFIASVSVFFPGSYSVDTWSMYDQVLHHNINDWHSPVVIFTWRVLLFLTKRFYSIYIVQLLLYWTFIFLLLSIFNKSIKVFVFGVLAAILLLFIPQYVMKDTHMVISWGIAVCLLLLTTDDRFSRHRKWLIAVALLLLAYGLFSRINMVAAMLPLAYIIADLLINKAQKTLLKALIAISICCGLIAINQYLTYNVFNATKVYPQYKLRLLDVAGISLKSGHNYFPPCITSYKDFSLDTIKALYSPASFDDIYWPANPPSVIPMPDSALNECANTAWKQAIKEHPVLYLKNRAKGFLYYLRIKKRFEDEQYWNVAIWIDPNNPLEISQHNSPYLDFFNSLYTSLAHTWFFAPWLWLLLNSVFFIYFFRKFSNNNSQAEFKIQALIQLSGVLAILSQFLIYQHDRDFRYSYWNVIVFFIGCVCAAQKTKKMRQEHCPAANELKTTTGGK